MDQSQFLIWAVLLGAFSAASLPLGSLLGLSWQPNNRVTAMFTAFGGGALIAALSIELVSPATTHLLNAKTEALHEEAAQHLINLLMGAIVGGILFTTLDEIVNSNGGFLRKTSTTIAYFSKRKKARRKRIIEHLGTSELVRLLPAEMVEEIVSHVNERQYAAGEQLFAQGDEGDVVYFIESGVITISQGANTIANLKAGDVLGEIALMTDARRTASATAKTNAVVLALPKEDFDHWRKESPVFDEAVQALAASRLKELAEHNNGNTDAKIWTEQALTKLTDVAMVPSSSELQKISEEHNGAPLAIWIGIFLDGIPESFVIGTALVVSISMAVSHHGADAVTFASIIPYTLIAGLFLANFPEAMSSSIGMKKQGWARSRIFLMWFSLMVMTGIGAGLGYWLGGNLDHGIVVAIEGIAAGAMLTMIASAMIPEAVHLGGGSVTGLSTLGGFISAVAFKFVE